VLYRRVRPGELRRFANELQQQVAGGAPFTCLLTNDRELRRLNREFLDHDYATDVLSFPGLEGMGELAISVERAAQQAGQFGHSLVEELRILMLHGVLHLTGLDHESDRGRMAREERDWRKRFGLPPSLTERARWNAGGR
jgi:probable rRNA maturation factor